MSSAALGSAALCGVEFGGVYLEKVLKESKQSIWMRNIQVRRIRNVVTFRTESLYPSMVEIRVITSKSSTMSCFSVPISHHISVNVASLTYGRHALQSPVPSSSFITSL